MEELYKPDDAEAKKVEVHSRENNDILGDLPEWLIHTGSYIVYGIIALLFLGTALFKYPNVVEKSIVIDDMVNVEWITANKSGSIDRFLIEDQAMVASNDTLGILKNTAELEDVKRFCRVLTRVEWFYRTNDIAYLQNYPFDLIMGEMTPAYEQFTQAVRTCVMEKEFDLYPQKEKYLKKELEIISRHSEAGELDLLKVKRELFELEMNHKMESARNRRLLELAYENMVNSLKSWEASYLIKSSSDGRVIWGKTWGMSTTINEGDTLCTVVSQRKGQPVGHIKLTQDEVAEVTKGNKVNVELAKYPAHTYGYLIGEVASVSYVPYNKSYAVEVCFPNGLVMTDRKQIDYEIGLSGKAEIITSSRSILSRIFTPIYQLFNKK